ncbi:MAG: MFS transporter [Pseudomonadota bacterium]
MLRNADFRRLWLSNALTSFSGQVSALALPLCAILLLGATPAQMGTLSAMQALPFALFGLPVGVWLDRNRKFPLLLGAELMFGLVLASIPLAHWLGLLSIHCLYVVGFLTGTGLVISGGAEQVFLTFLVGRSGLIDAQARFAATESASRLLGPALAGLLVQILTAPVVILFNACAFFISLLNLRRIRARESVPAPTGTHPMREMKDGLAFVWGHPLLRTLAWSAGSWHFLFFGYTALQILFATRVLGMSPGALGMTGTLGGIGILASSILLKPLSRRFGAGRTILIGLSCTTVGFVLIPMLPPALFGSGTATVIAFGILVMFFDCGVMLFFMPYMALRQRVTPDAFLGRMVSTMRFLTVAVAPLGALAAGYIGDHFGVRSGLACVAAGAIALTLWMVLMSPLRSVKD